MQMNSSNQASSNVKQLRLQAPLSALEKFAICIDELRKMYPDTEEKKESD